MTEWNEADTRLWLDIKSQINRKKATRYKVNNNNKNKHSHEQRAFVSVCLCASVSVCTDMRYAFAMRLIKYYIGRLLTSNRFPSCLQFFVVSSPPSSLFIFFFLFCCCCPFSYKHCIHIFYLYAQPYGGNIVECFSLSLYMWVLHFLTWSIQTYLHTGTRRIIAKNCTHTYRQIYKKKNKKQNHQDTNTTTSTFTQTAILFMVQFNSSTLGTVNFPFCVYPMDVITFTRLYAHTRNTSTVVRITNMRICHNMALSSTNSYTLTTFGGFGWCLCLCVHHNIETT